MLSFFPHILFLLSVAGIIIIFGKKLPTLKNTTDVEPLNYEATTSFLYDVFRSAHILFSRFFGYSQREKVFIYLEKLLRKVKVLLMRWENKLSKALEYFSTRSSQRILKERFDQESKHRISWDDIRQTEGNFFSAKPKSSAKDGFKKIADPILASSNSDADLNVIVRQKKKSAPISSNWGSGEVDRKSKSSKQEQSVQISPVSIVSTNSEEEEFWLSVLRQNPHNPHPYKKLGEIYMNRGEYHEAKAAFVYVLKRNPDDQETMKWLENIKRK
ncbi:MAG: hypothetical protein HYV65_00040 [Candidatus Spechtbacteria bacterium]|nr:hypothetical protein [Candidatus Spechtbacteria bacterium]